MIAESKMMKRTGTTPAKLMELAIQANLAHQACEAAVQSALHHARDCGTALLAAKKLAKHGHFEDWVSSNCKFSVRMARTYMTLARNWDQLMALSKRNRASDLALDSLSVREALRLLAAGGPETGEWIFLDKHCPSCGERLVVTSALYATCPSCFNCRLHPLPHLRPLKPFARSQNHARQAIGALRTGRAITSVCQYVDGTTV